MKVREEMVLAYPEVFPLYQRLAGFHSLSVENFLLTAGSDTAIRHCFETFVAPGDKVFYPEPTFAMVPIYGGLFCADMKAVTYDEELHLDIEYLLGAIDNKTSLVVLANPNSPTGKYESNFKVAKILEKAAHFRVPVLIDEAYYGFCPHTAAGLMKDYANLIITRSFSKISGMAGLRVGYAMGSPGVISLLTKFRPMYEVNSIGILFACEILDNWEVAETYGRQTIAGRERFSAFLKGCGFSVINTETNFLHVNFGLLKDAMLNALNAKDILVRGMLNIRGYENYTRFSVGPWEYMNPVVDVIKSVLHCNDGQNHP
ncbi:MAG: histidinol-phosphate transaminase [Proteobacteria bacterium]|nr:histidinol-phosphate transaminase [Pseudomonadota bacterium]